MLSKLFEVHHFKLWKRIWNVLLFQQWLYKDCRKKLILKNWNAIKRLQQECMMTCLQNIFWTIYKGLFTTGEKMSHQRIFLSECGTLNIIHHFQKNHTKDTVINELITEQFVWKKGNKRFLGNSCQNFLTRIQKINNQY